MRTKKFIEKFDTEMNELIPDNKEQIKARLGIQEKPEKKHSFIFAKPLLAFSLVFLMVIGLTALFNGGNHKPDINVNNMGSVIKTKEDVYAYSALSTSTLLSKKQANTQSLSSVVTDDQLDKINYYVSMFDSLISEEGFKQVTEDNPDSNYSKYKTKMTVSVGDMNYVSYYNEEALNEEDEDEDEDEIETRLNGIMILDGEEYKIVGTKEIEADELEIKMMSIIDDNNYVKVEQEIENGEQEFLYEVKNNGVVEHSKIEIEQEENKELEIKLQLGENEDNAEIYEFKRKLENNIAYLEIEVYQGEDNLVEKIKVKTIIKSDGAKVNEYTFEDNSTKEVDD